jgi:serine/threonine protein kinase
MSESVQPADVEERLRATVAQLSARSPDETIRAPAEQRASLPPSLPRLAIERVDRDAPESPTVRREVVRRGDLLGVGGMGEVYTGVQRSLGRSVALKFVTEEEDSIDHEAREALLREARITGRLEHPNIVPVHVLGVDEGGVPVMVMKRIEGVSWRALLRDREHPQWRRWETQHRDALEAHVSVLLSVCDALEYAHKKRIVHRDIKPDNVMIGPFGEVYLLDWGIALDLDAPGSRPSVVGTPSYMAPEMLDGAPAAVTERTDVFLLGATLHFALTGRPRHEGDSLMNVLSRVAACEPIAYGDEVPDELAQLCNDATAREPEQRVATVARFRERLAGYLRRRPSHALALDAETTLDRAEAIGLDHGKDREIRWRTLADSKLGFTRALAQWPENPRAARGLDRALVAMIRHAIATEDASAARAMHTERAKRDPVLDAEVSALEERVEKDRERAARWAKSKQELDTSGTRRERTFMLALVGGLFVVVTLAIAATDPEGRSPPTLLQKLGGEATVTAAAITLLYLQRARLLCSRGSRRITGAIAATGAALCASTIVSILLGVTIHGATVLSMFLLVVVYATLAVFSVRIWPAAVAACAGTLLIAAMPARMSVIVSATAGMIVLSVLDAAARGRLYGEQDTARRG